VCSYLRKYEYVLYPLTPLYCQGKLSNLFMKSLESSNLSSKFEILRILPCFAYYIVSGQIKRNWQKVEIFLVVGRGALESLETVRVEDIRAAGVKKEAEGCEVGTLIEAAIAC
jgi:hypothetical protein